MKRINLFLLAAMVLAFAACTPSENNTPKELTGISLNKKSIEIEVGGTYQLRVLYEPEDAEDGAPDVIWDSSKGRIASVNDNGKVEAKAIGKTTITATCGKFSAECEVEVIKATEPTPDPEISFSVSPEKIDAPAEGGTFDITVKSNTSWTAEVEDDWATLSETSGNGDAALTLTIDAADSEYDYSQKITFSAGKGTYYVTVNREGKQIVTNPITIDQSEIKVPVTGGTYTVNITSETDSWSATCDNSNVTITKSGKAANIAVKVNKEKSYRPMDVVFTDGKSSATLTLKQEAAYIELVGSTSFNGFGVTSKTFNTTIKSNIPWKIVFEYEQGYPSGWASASPSTGKAGETPVTLTFTMQKNTTSSGYFNAEGTGDWAGLSFGLGNIYY